MSASTPAIQQWAQEWGDQYDQEIEVSSLAGLVGKNVQGEGRDANGQLRGFTKIVVGYGRDVLAFRSEDEAVTEFVYRPTLITEDGLQVPIFAGMTLVEVESE